MLDTTEQTVTVDLISALQDTAMLCGLRTRALGLARTAKNSSLEVSKAAGATSQAATVRVNRLADADGYHRKIIGLQNHMRKVYEANTLPWDQMGGWRLLPNEGFMRMSKLVQPIKLEIEKLLQEYKEKAPDIIAHARKSLGKLADEIEPPTLEELMSSYETRLEFNTLSDVKALKNLPPALAQRLSQHMEQRASTAYTEAMTELQDRMVMPLQHLIGRLDAFDEREARPDAEAGKRDLIGVFRDTTVTNIHDLAATLPLLNLLGDEKLKDNVSSVVTLAASITPESLRASRDKRDAARVEARAILERMGL